MISTLQQLIGITQEARFNTMKTGNFNANLPITVHVLKQLDPFRYRLKVGRKELSTKSHKALKEGEAYWGDFSQNQEGILTLSALSKQPYCFQNRAFFLELPLESFLSEEPFRVHHFKKIVLQAMLNPKMNQTLFTTLSTMLLALENHTVHLPLLLHEKRCVVQFSLKEEALHFYLACEHLGPMQGFMDDKTVVLEALYSKTLFYLKKSRSPFPFDVDLRMNSTISPLFDTHERLLDMKG